MSFYVNYARVCGSRDLTFNMHSMLHVMDVRDKKGPLWKLSTAPFESMYARLRRGFSPSTKNAPKQMIGRFYAGMLHDKHKCKTGKVRLTKLKADDNPESRHDDSIVYYCDDFYRIIAQNDLHYTLRQIKTALIPTSSEMRPGPELPFHLVGARKYVKEGSHTLKVHRANVHCQGMLCRNIISTYRREWLA